MPDEFDLAWFQVSQEKESESFYDLKHNTETIKQLIDDEIAKGIRPDRIVLAGFSQGCFIRKYYTRALAEGYSSFRRSSSSRLRMYVAIQAGRCLVLGWIPTT